MPLIGAEPVVPIIAISAVFTNLSRTAAYLRYADRRRALIVISAAALTTALGAYGYTRLTNAGAAQVLAFAVLIGTIALPGAFFARAFVECMPLHIHTAILDVAVIAGGVVMISAALRQLL